MRKIVLLFALIIPVALSAQPGIITTFAGIGSTAHTGDGGPASAAAIGQPASIGIDGAGNFYFEDGFNHLIRKINSSGIISPFAGTGVAGTTGDSGPATAATITGGNLACDAAGNVYLTSSVTAIRKINTSGIISLYAGMGVMGYSGDGGPATAALLNYPGCMAADNLGNLFITDNGNYVIRKVNSAGIISTVAGSGIVGFSGDGGPATSANIYPGPIAVDNAGNLYISDSSIRIRKVNPAGIITTIYSGPYHVTYMQLDAAGNIYFCDGSNYRIRKINTSGVVTTLAGNGINTYSGDGGPATAAGLYGPGAMVLDGARNIYECEYSGERVRKIENMPDVVATSFTANVDRTCGGVAITVASHSTLSLNVNTSFGDGTSTLTPLTTASLGNEAANIAHSYASPGTYTINMVLLNGTTPIDSATYSFSSVMCHTCEFMFYYDANGNCVKDAGEPLSMLPILTEVDSNGTPVDTISCLSGFDYTATGNPGDVYKFKVISLPSTAMSVSCPSSGALYDTLASLYVPGTRYFGLTCGTGTGFDLSEVISTRSGPHSYRGDAIIYNTYCAPQTATFTANITHKYNFTYGSPTPTTVAGNTVSWNLTGLDVFAPPQYIHWYAEVPGTWLTIGDTSHSDYETTPTTGDVNPANNSDNVIDTVRSGWDPNAMIVSPEGMIAAGTTLKYTIDFENDGNDTAQNIYVLDTLNDYLDIKSMKVIAASATMKTIPYKAGHNIVRFDFPGIKLLDSTHHNGCSGMLQFTIKTSASAPIGTIIKNEAGIYFDDNPVVMTNSVTNIIGHTAGITPVTNVKTRIFPNPATDQLTIVTDNNIYDNLVITNTMGQNMITQKLNSLQTTISMKDLPAGVYFIRLSGEGGSLVKQFVKL